MKNIYNINDMNNNTSNENGASITKLIRPGSDEYDKIHINEKIDKLPDCFNDVCNKLIDDDNLMEEFAKLYINKINECIVSGKKVGTKAYWLYEHFRYRHDTL